MSDKMTDEEAIEALTDKKVVNPYLTLEALEIAIDALRERAERKKGKWISEMVDGEDWKGCKRQYYQPTSCSKCHSPNLYKSAYCPNCGAQMEVDE